MIAQALDRRIIRVLNFLEDHVDEEFSVRQLADKVHLSQSRFSHLFAMKTGLTPGAHLRTRRRFMAEQRLAKAILERHRKPFKVTGIYRIGDD